MNLVFRKSLGGVSSLRKEMDNLENHFLGDTYSPRSFSQAWLPSVDVSVTKDNFLVMAELHEGQ